MIKNKLPYLLIVFSGLAFALGAFILAWIESRYVLKLFSTEMYTICIAVVFTVSGIWLGKHLSRKRREQSFEQNDQAIQSLGITNRELDVLTLLATGSSNKEIAKQLFVSLSTIKTHLIHLYQKLEVSRRTQAIQRAQKLRIIP